MKVSTVLFATTIVNAQGAQISDAPSILSEQLSKVKEKAKGGFETIKSEAAKLVRKGSDAISSRIVSGSSEPKTDSTERVETREISKAVKVDASRIVHGTEKEVIESTEIVDKPVSTLVTARVSDMVTRTKKIQDVVSEKVDGTKIVKRDVSRVVHDTVSEAVPVSHIETRVVERDVTEKVPVEKVVSKLVRGTEKVAVPHTEVRSKDVSHVEHYEEPAVVKGTEKIVHKEEKATQYDRLETASGKATRSLFEVPLRSPSTSPDMGAPSVVDDSSHKPVVTVGPAISLPDMPRTSPDMTAPSFPHDSDRGRPITVDPQVVVPDSAIRTSGDMTQPVFLRQKNYRHSQPVDDIDEIVPEPTVINVERIVPVVLPDRSALITDQASVQFIEVLFRSASTLADKLIVVDIGNSECVVVKPSSSALTGSPKLLVHELLRNMPRNRISCFCSKVVASTYKWMHTFSPTSSEQQLIYDLFSYVSEVQNTYKRYKAEHFASERAIDGELVDPESQVVIKIVDPTHLGSSGLTSWELDAVEHFLS